MLSHAFRFVGTVVFLIGPQNYRSQKAVEKIGGVRDGSRPNAAGRDSLVYRIDAATFRRGLLRQRDAQPTPESSTD